MTGNGTQAVLHRILSIPNNTQIYTHTKCVDLPKSGDGQERVWGQERSGRRGGGDPGHTDGRLGFAELRETSLPSPAAATDAASR